MEHEIQRRGVLTKRIKEKASEVLGKEITTVELRLMPYVQHCMLNEQKIHPQRVNAQERAILMDWQKCGWIEAPASGMSISKQFWDAICEILFLAYVDTDE